MLALGAFTLPAQSASFPGASAALAALCDDADVACPSTPSVHGSWSFFGFEWTAGGDNSPFALRMTDDVAFAFASLNLSEGITLSDVEQVGFDVFYVAGSCGGGSPRVQLSLDTDGDGRRNGNLFGYAGPAPSFVGCPTGEWIDEDLNDGVGRWDALQLGGGWGIPFETAKAIFPDAKVLRATYVWDSSWMFEDYQVAIDNLRFDGAVLAEPGVGEACTLAAVRASSVPAACPST